MFFTIIYSSIICLGFILYIGFRKRFDIGVLLLSMWVISAISSIYLYIDDGNGFRLNVQGHVTLLPYLYLLFVLGLSFIPILRIDNSKIKYVSARNYEKLLFAVSVIFIFVSILPLVENIYQLFYVLNSDYSYQLSNVYDTKRLENIVTWHSEIGKKFNTLLLVVNKVTPVLLFYWLSSHKVSLRFKIFSMLPVVNSVLHSFLMSSRASLFMDCVYLLFCILLFKHTFSSQLWKNITRSAFIALSGGVGLFLLITISRFDVNISQRYSFSLVSWLAIYAGESALRFNVFMWNIKEYMIGDYTFSGIKYLLGFDVPTDLLLREFYLYFKIGLFPNVFYTYVGDLYGDFGPYITILLVGIAVFPIAILRVENNTVSFHSILYLAIWYSVCVYGFTYFPYKVSFLNYSLLVQVIFVICLAFIGREKNELQRNA